MFTADETQATTNTVTAPAEPTLPAAVKIDRTLRLPTMIFCSALQPANGRLFCGGADFAVYAVETTAEKPEATQLSMTRHESYVSGMVCTTEALISGSYDGSLIWWDTAAGSVIRQVTAAHERWIRRLALSPDGKKLASVADDMLTRIRDAQTGELLLSLADHEKKTPNGYPSMLYAVAWSPDNTRIATGDKTGRVLIRSALDGTIVKMLETPVMYTWDPRQRQHSIGGIRSLAFSPDGNLLAVGGMGKVNNIDHLEGPSRIEVFRLETGERILEIEDQKLKGLVERLQFSPDSRWLLAAGGDHGGFMSAWNVTDGKLLAQEKLPVHVHDFAMTRADHVIAVGHDQAVFVKV